MTSASAGPLRPRRSAAWSVIWRAGYRFLRLVDPLIRSWIANGLPGLGGIVELRSVGRRSGAPRRTLLTLLGVDGRWYVSHCGWGRGGVYLAPLWWEDGEDDDDTSSPVV